MTSAPQPIYLNDYTPSPYSISETSLRFELDPEKTKVTSELKVSRGEHLPVDTPLELNGDQLEPLEVYLDGLLLAEGDYEASSKLLTLRALPQSFTLTIITEIAPAHNKELMGLYASSGNFCTQCEAEGFRRITYYLDRPDVLSVFTTELIADREAFPTLLSNGNLIESTLLPEGKHRALWRDPYPKPSYLFALVAGQFDQISGRYTTRSGREVDLQIYTDKGQADQCYHALEAVKKSMRWDEENYGREYDLDLFMIVAVNDFNFGAMENKGLNIFNAKYILASEKTATDADFSSVDTVVAHEYFHNWSGNRVTLRDWFQLSLKEGFTVYRDQSFDEDNISKMVHRINAVNRLRSAQFKEDQGPMAHPVQPKSYLKIDNFYTTTIYNKGAEIIRMFNLILGDEAFRAASEDYFERFDGQAVTIQDFAAVMQAHTALDLTPFLLWYDQSGTPRLTVTDEYSSEAQTYRLTIRQSLSNRQDSTSSDSNLPMLIPIKIGLISSSGESLETPELYRGELFLLDQAEQTITFNGVSEPPTPSLLRHFSAPVRCDYDYTTDQLELLMRFDVDGVNRWQAGQHLAMGQLQPLIEAAQEGRPLEDLKELVSPRYLGVMRSTLLEEIDDLYYHAQLLTLPSESFLTEQMEVVDVDAIHLARKTLKGMIAESTRGILQEKYDLLGQEGSAKYDVAQMGRRVLRNTCLSYLCTLSRDDVPELVMAQFNESLETNMTDAIAALTELSHLDHPYRHHALETFERMWSNAPLLMNKWLNIQSSAHQPNALKSVEGLLEHSAFSLENPNSVYALVYGFAMNHPVAFHDRSGDGYRFLASMVREVDQINPMVAARIVVPLTHWRRYDSERGALMRAELEAMTREKKMSDNLLECVTKSL